MPDVRPRIVPLPAHYVSFGEYQPGPGARMIVRAGSAEARAIAEELAADLRRQTGWALPLEEAAQRDPAQPFVALRIREGRDTADFPLPAASSDSPEGYDLSVANNAVVIVARRPAGLFYGGQTLRQHLCRSRMTQAQPPAWVFPSITICDSPRFAHRGMLLDCGRHFMPKEFVKRYIDLLAMHKLNVLHWHLTEDQGWRIEIKKYPKLTEIGAWRAVTRDSERKQQPGSPRYGGFYSQDDIRDILAYAKSRYVTVIPEIEMPGHSQAALAAYPELSCTGGPFEVGTKWGIYDDVYCAGNERTLAFLEDVLSEVIELFPSQFIHIGGDECPKTRWKACPKCQARMKAEGLKDENELQSWFIRRIDTFLTSKGRRLIGWDEILEGGLAPNATVQSWRGMQGALAAARAGHDVICSPTSHCYLDYPHAKGEPGYPEWMGSISLRQAYSFDPILPQLTADEARRVLGLEGNLWSEWAPPDLVDWNVFPRLCALAEVGWSRPGDRTWEDFEARMRSHYTRLDGLGVAYHIPPPRFASVSPSASGGQFELATFTPLEPPVVFYGDATSIGFMPRELEGEIRYTLDGSEPSVLSAKYAAPFALKQTAVVKARLIAANDRLGLLAEGRFEKRALREPVAAGDAQPGLLWEYYEGQWARLPLFDTFAPLRVALVPEIAARGTLVRRGDAFAQRFSGLFDAPADGVFTFHLKSDDGSRLLIGDQVVVDNDGAHAATEKSGQIGLKQGKHPLRIEHFELRGDETLAVRVEGPGLPLQPLPAAALRVSRECYEQAAARVGPGALDLPETVRPVPREPGPWMQRHEELCRRSAQSGARLIFIGDSITQGWETEGKPAWDKHFAARGAVNLGLSGDRTQHVLWRLLNGNLAGFARDPAAAPKLAVVMIGTNNSNGVDHSVEEIGAGIVSVVRTLRDKLPATRVLLLAIFPRGAQPDAQRQKNAKASQFAAERLANDKLVTYLDIGKTFLEPDESLSKEVMPDFLHLSPRGYKIWAEAIEPAVKQLLGE